MHLQSTRQLTVKSVVSRISVIHMVVENLVSINTFFILFSNVFTHYRFECDGNVQTVLLNMESKKVGKFP